MFIDIVLYCAGSIDRISLEQACTEVSNMHGVEVRKQSLDERFHQGAVEFIKSILSDILRSQLMAEIAPEFLNDFNQVRITDSTKFNVPPSLKDFFKGFNGNDKRAAGVSIQYEFDIKNAKVLNLDLFGATKSDSNYAGEISGDIQPKDLVIRDLGYYSTNNLLKIVSKEAYFITRLNAKADVYMEGQTGKLEKVCFKKLYEQMSLCKQTDIEIPVYIGKNKKLPVRLIIQLMPEEVYTKRKVKLEKYNKANGHQTSCEIKDRLRFNLFVTNIEPDKMEAHEVSIIYKLRWQVELVFKCWKSHLQIHNIQKMKYERFATILYGKLLMIIINNEIVQNIRCKLYRTEQRLLSTAKCAKTMRKNFFTRKIAANPEKLTGYVLKIEKLLSLNHWQEKRKKRVGMLEIMELFNRIPNNYTIFEEKRACPKTLPLNINKICSLVS